MVGFIGAKLLAYQAYLTRYYEENEFALWTS